MKFAGAEQAIRFSYNISKREIAAKPSYSLEARGSSQDGLGPHELHAQGALIQQALNRLPERERTAVIAFLAPHDTALQACAEMSELLYPAVNGIVPTKEAVYDALCVWMRKHGNGVVDGGVRAIAAKHSVSFRQVMKWRDAVASKFSPFYLRGIELMEGELFHENGLEQKV